MKTHEYIEIKNARIHNLKGVDVRIPKRKLTVITGVSGSGKSSLAFDTLYEEGKRRYLMFSGTDFMIDSVPTFDSITGLAPTVAVEQRTIRQSNPRSTVGTRLKISPMLAALFANFATRDPAYDDGIPLDIAMFQRNAARGMCVKCLGKGTFQCLNEEALFADRSQHIYEIALGLGRRAKIRPALMDFCRIHHIDYENDLLSDLTPEQLFALQYGDGTSKFLGYIPLITMLINGAQSTSGRLSYLLHNAGLMERKICPKCDGTGLGEQARHTTYRGKTITELEDMYISGLLAFFREGRDKPNLVNEIEAKLSCLEEVGIGHLSLSRPLPTLSGGEIQRLFLASYTITEMDSIIFIFDEPTIGLHEIEKENLIRIIRRLVEKGNTVIAVEHDANFMREADYIVDMGPGAGVCGGLKIYEGGFNEFLSCHESKTAPYLSEMAGLPQKTGRRPINKEKMLTLAHANLHNLKDVTAEIPLGVMLGIAGVSGSGKSSLIHDTLVPKLREQMRSKCITDEEEADDKMPVTATLYGTEHLKKCYVIDQRPIGRSRTSSPVTYTGIFDRVRTMFANTEDAKRKGYPAGMFSVNSVGGCKKCKGDGVIHYHVGFGNFIDIPCDACEGHGYLPEVMDVLLDGKNIRDILEMNVDEAKLFFRDKDSAIYKTLDILQRVGLGYLGLGQATPTISGGESQRIKLAKELTKGKQARDALYILDEPTTGLSFYDSEQLMALLNELVDAGNSIIVTEHDPYILSQCDYILELGRGGGDDGGSLIAEGTPEDLMQNPESIIGRYLTANGGKA